MAGAASQAGDADSSRAPGITSVLQGSVNVNRGVLLLVPHWQCTSSFVFYSFVTLVPLCRVELVIQCPVRGSTQVLLFFFLVCCSCDTSDIVSVHIQCQASIYTLSCVEGIHDGADSQEGDADSSRAPGLTSGLQRFVNVHRGALLLMPQWQCISSFVIYIVVTLVPFSVLS